MSRASGGGRTGVSVHLEVEGQRRERERPQEVARPSDAPFAILLVGDFRGVGEGAPHGAQPPFGERSPLQVDRDDLDDVLRTLRPAVLVKGTGAVPDQRIDFRALRDFHPDRLIDAAPVPRRLLEERERAGSVEGTDPSPDPDEAPPGKSGAAEALPGSQVLDRILESTAASGAAASEARGGAGEDRPDPLAAASDLEGFVRRITEPHRVPDDSEAEASRRAALDRELTYQLRHILHDGRFRALEARWRGLSLLVHRLETDPDLKVFVLQADPRELESALAEDGLEGALVRSAREALRGAPWGLVVVDRAFGARLPDLRALTRLAEAGRAAGSGVVAEADPSLLGLEAGDEASEEVTRAWSELREREAARHLGLLLPRFLARLPYADGENPCERFDFQELQLRRSPDPDQLLWGHPGILAAILLGTAFRRDGWGLVPGRPDRVDDLPLALHRGEDGVNALPTVEVLLERAQAAGLIEAGFIPVLGRPEEGAARIPAFPSVAASGAVLHGGW